MPKLLFNRPREFIEDRLKKVDLVCVDLDKCLFPFFSQTFVGICMCLETLVNPFQWKYLSQLLRGARFIVPATIKNLLGGRRSNNDCFMDKYEEVMCGVPVSLIRRHSRCLHNFLCPYSLRFLKTFADRKTPVAILSLSIQPILQVLEEKIGFIECIGNKVELNKNSATFYRYGMNRMKYGKDKLESLKDLMKNYRAKTPLIIGHSKDEMPMVEYSRKLTGLSIGITPKITF